MAVGFKTPTYPELPYTQHRRGDQYIAPVPTYGAITGAEGGLPITTEQASPSISPRYYVYAGILAVSILGVGIYYDHWKGKGNGR